MKLRRHCFRMQLNQLFHFQIPQTIVQCGDKWDKLYNNKSSLKSTLVLNRVFFFFWWTKLKIKFSKTAIEIQTKSIDSSYEINCSESISNVRLIQIFCGWMIISYVISGNVCVVIPFCTHSIRFDFISIDENRARETKKKQNTFSRWFECRNI